MTATQSTYGSDLNGIITNNLLPAAKGFTTKSATTSATGDHRNLRARLRSVRALPRSRALSSMRQLLRSPRLAVFTPPLSSRRPSMATFVRPSLYTSQSAPSAHTSWSLAFRAARPLHTSSPAWKKLDPLAAVSSWFLRLKEGQSEESAKHVFEDLRDYVRSALEMVPPASLDHLTISSNTLSFLGSVPVYMDFAYTPEFNYRDVHELSRGGIGIRVPAEYEEIILAILKRAPAHLKARVKEAVRDGPAVLCTQMVEQPDLEKDRVREGHQEREFCAETIAAHTRDRTSEDFEAVFPVLVVNGPGCTQITTFPSLGDLSVLPPEIRLLVFGHVVPEDFKQVHRFGGDYSCLSRGPKSSKPISVLYASQTIREEALESLLSIRTCKLTISSSEFATNFPLRDEVFGPPQESDTVNFAAFTACKFLDITVHIPYPRSANGLAEVRRTVRKVVDLLNGSGRAMPPIRASLTGEHHNSEVYTYNDYAMLLGPLARLDRVDRGCTISCSSPLTPGFVDPPSLKQCQLIEAAMKSDASQQQRLLLQQALFDIKLQLAWHQDGENLTSRFDPAAGPQVLGSDRAANIWQALQELKEPVSMLKSAVAPWAAELESVIKTKGRSAVIERGLMDRILGGYTVSEYILWASGHQTARNPYYSQ